jgi:NADPH-dependent glutamate synthase beta subunit-like oxidoreductase/glutamate synthase domain-containing protein 3/NAD-dependent dihydropyrimidine dehydrogenase PreA subunit
MQDNIVRISGLENGARVESRILEERIQRAVKDGCRHLEIDAYGQHGIGGRLWSAGQEPVYVKVAGSPGQRIGSKGFPNTRIEIFGPGAEDVGWLNAGAEIVIHGHAGNGCCNAMAQGKVFVAGNIGARGMTMTKRNPRFAPPELWVLGSVGDYFAEFMAGGVAVICGHEPQEPSNLLGYRPCVGMVGGKIYFRGPHKGFSQADAKLEPIDDASWSWLTQNLDAYLTAIGKSNLFDALSRREDWQCLAARNPFEKANKKRRAMSSFRKEIWDAELGMGGLIGDLTTLDRSPIPLIVNDELRRFVPVWENKKYLAPCQSTCPTGIPVQERWSLIRSGKIDEALDLALAYTPFPATVCGYLCPNLCMQGCTRQLQKMAPVDVTVLGKASIKAEAPALPPLSDKRVAVIGGGPSGISMAWQIRLKGHDAVIYDMDKTLGGKIASAIPSSRIPKDIVDAELERIRKVLPHVHLQQKLTKDEFEQLKNEFDFVVIAIGSQQARILPIPGKERAMGALEFLKKAKRGEATMGERLVIVGAGNVGCDVATEAARLGAKDITLIDIQKPAAFGKEKKDAEEVGAKFRWPCFSKEITAEGLVLSTGELLPADNVIFSIGDGSDLGFLPPEIAHERGFIKVDAVYQTTDPKVFAIGDIVRPGLITDAIGAGRKAADAIGDILAGKRPQPDQAPKMIDTARVSLEYFDPRITEFADVNQCAGQCSSCGSCRDCGVCENVCPRGAISRVERPNNGYEYVVDAGKCIGCGFCAGACPCGVWSLMENTPLE